MTLVAGVAMFWHAHKYYCVTLQALGHSPGFDPPPVFTPLSLLGMMWIVWLPWLLMVAVPLFGLARKWYYGSMCVLLLAFVWGNLTILSDMHNISIPLVPR